MNLRDKMKTKPKYTCKFCQQQISHSNYEWRTDDDNDICPKNTEDPEYPCHWPQAPDVVWTYDDKYKDSPALRQETVFHITWSNCPLDLKDEVRDLWAHNELSNGSFYMWDSDDDYDGRDYPLIDKYLRSQNITKCWIYYWW